MGKHLGQHFLTSPVIARRIVDVANILPNDIVLEVGPGKGMLTQFLVEKAKLVIAVEKDKQLVQYLREKFKDTKNLKIVYGDILKIPLNPPFSKGELLPLKKGGWEGFFDSNFKIVANLPYYITSHFLRLFLETNELRPQSMTLMVQKEVAERICAKPPHMNMLALSVQTFGVPKIIFKVSKNNFAPPPEVDSAVIAIENISDVFFKKHNISPQQFFKLPKKAFSQKRKMLRSSLKLTRHRVSSQFEMIRPQELSLEDWAFLCPD
ncbi:MAG: 16S rRNA (adenine1518-N6/adenine1519-N6)-dimethyltransferase [Parcubacteria group bacterium Gr01-1014_29]|nr:MAG: 16S rRNA (adenine1518-N6/adenine1519-N6)-dimethyltransferase [Parcubacteria group bacterium Gr01-1014_29]